MVVRVEGVGSAAVELGRVVGVYDCAATAAWSFCEPESKMDITHTHTYTHTDTTKINEGYIKACTKTHFIPQGEYSARVHTACLYTPCN